MARVAVLTHVKERTVVEAPPLVRVRIPWTGGKIVSNKDEALRKFYERKLQNGATTLTTEQQQRLKASLAELRDAPPSKSQENKKHSRHHKSKHDVVHKINATTKRMVHRGHVKVQGNGHHSKKTVIVNGRVVGPKGSAARTPKITGVKKQPQQKKPSGNQKSRPSDTGLALQDKLGMSLDALVKRSAP